MFKPGLLPRAKLRTKALKKLRGTVIVSAGLVVLPATWDHVGICCFGHDTVSSIPGHLPRAMVSSGPGHLPRVMSGSTTQQQLGSGLMSVAPDATGVSAESQSHISHLRLCSCLRAMLPAKPYLWGWPVLPLEATMVSRPELLPRAMSGSYSSQGMS